MMSILEYSVDVNLDVEKILALCDSLGIDYIDENSTLSDEDIILLDNNLSELENMDDEEENEDEEEILENEDEDEEDGDFVQNARQTELKNLVLERK